MVTKQSHRLELPRWHIQTQRLALQVDRGGALQRTYRTTFGWIQRREEWAAKKRPEGEIPSVTPEFPRAESRVGT